MCSWEHCSFEGEGQVFSLWPLSGNQARLVSLPSLHPSGRKDFRVEGVQIKGGGERRQRQRWGHQCSGVCPQLSVFEAVPTGWGM